MESVILYSSTTPVGFATRRSQDPGFLLAIRACVHSVISLLLSGCVFPLTVTSELHTLIVRQRYNVSHPETFIGVVLINLSHAVEQGVWGWGS